MKKNFFLVFILTRAIKDLSRVLNTHAWKFEKLNSEGIIVVVLDKVGKISWERIEVNFF